jgi:hypothetical protein
MNRRQVFYLRIVAVLLVMLLMLPVSVALDQKMENILEDEIGETDSASKYNETELMEQETGSSFNFLKSMLQTLDLNLSLINGTLNARVGEYPFLQPAIDGTEAGMATTGSIIDVLGSDPENLSEMQEALISLNENVAELNSSVGYLDGMIEAANSTSGESYGTVPASEDIFRSLGAMVEVLD